MFENIFYTLALPQKWGVILGKILTWIKSKQTSQINLLYMFRLPKDDKIGFKQAFLKDFVHSISLPYVHTKIVLQSLMCHPINFYTEQNSVFIYT